MPSHILNQQIAESRLDEVADVSAVGLDGALDGSWIDRHEEFVVRLGQRLTVLVALDTSVYAAFEETSKGSLIQGKLADMAVLSHDIMTVPLPKLLSAEVEMTIVGGKIVYEKPAKTVEK